MKFLYNFFADGKQPIYSVNLIKISTRVDWHSAVCINGRYCLLQAKATCNITKIIKTTIGTFNTFYMYLRYMNEVWGHRAGRVTARTMPGSDSRQATSLHPTAQHWVHCASYCTTPAASCSVTCRFPWLDPSPVIVVLLTYHAHFGDLILLFEYGMASDQMNGCLYYRIYWYISIFEFLKL